MKSHTAHIHVAIFKKRVQGTIQGTIPILVLSNTRHETNVQPFYNINIAQNRKPINRIKSVYMYLETYLVLSKVISFKTILF